MNYLSRIYQYIYDKLKCRVLAVPSYLLVRSVFRLRYAAKRNLKENIPAAENAEKKLNALFARPACRHIDAVQPESDGTDLTVIVPAYCAEKDIERCIRSIISQKTEFSMEILVIDDGSGDRTGEILDRLARESKCLKVFHRENSGASASRNFGLDHAHGSYVMFADADDSLLPGAVEALMQAAIKENADLVQGSWKYENGPVQRFPETVKEKEALTELLEIPGMPWGKVIKRELFSDVRFPEKFTSYVDSPIKWLVFRSCSRIVLISDVVYSWQRNPKGITYTSKNSFRCLQTVWIYREMDEESRNLGLPEDLLYKLILVNQLTAITVGRISGMEKEIQKNVFALCRDMAAQKIKTEEISDWPYAQKQAYLALMNDNFEGWKFLGNKWNYIL